MDPEIRLKLGLFEDGDAARRSATAQGPFGRDARVSAQRVDCGRRRACARRGRRHPLDWGCGSSPRASLSDQAHGGSGPLVEVHVGRISCPL